MILIIFSYTKAQTFADCIGHELPYGWEECFDGQIGVYYVDHINSEYILQFYLLLEFILFLHLSLHIFSTHVDHCSLLIERRCVMNPFQITAQDIHLFHIKSLFAYDIIDVVFSLHSWSFKCSVWDPIKYFFHTPGWCLPLPRSIPMKFLCMMGDVGIQVIIWGHGVLVVNENEEKLVVLKDYGDWKYST